MSDLDNHEERQRLDELLEQAIQARVAHGNKEIKDALITIAKWVPDAPYGAMDFGFEEHYGPVPEEQTEFFTESVLYPLVGKEDARTIMALLGLVARGVGYKGWWDVQREAFAEGES